MVAVVLPNALNVWYSYSNDYQPQGRYSMPMLVPFMYYVVRGVGFFGTRVQERWGERGKKFGGVVWGEVSDGGRTFTFEGFC